MILHFLFILLSIMTFERTNSLNQEINTVETIDKYVSLLNEKELQTQAYYFDGEYKEGDATTVVSVGSSEIIGYYEKDELLKIKVFYNGSHGNLITSIYCKGGKLVFVQKTLEIFDPPKFDRGNKLKAVILNEYYLSENKIISFKHEGGVIKYNIPGEIDFKKKNIELNKDFESYTKLLSK